MNAYKKIFIASDHAGYILKQYLIKEFKELPWQDLGPSNEDSVDYPDYAKKLCNEVIANPENSTGILICGSGQGMAMTANKLQAIRAALCWSDEVAKLSRAHNDANVLCIGSRLINPNLAKTILATFLETPFEGGRHADRVKKIKG